MADTRKIVKIFLASPGDLKEERTITKSVVDEFNNVWADVLGYHVELVGWEDTVSVFGRPQATINLELARCELFIGMLWKRWGTASDVSSRYTSGFEEEFNISVESRQKTGRPEISLFLKSVDDEILRDPGDDLKKVIAFKDKIISAKILLYETFSDAGEFEGKVRRCISTYVQRLKAKEINETSDESRTRPTESASKGISEERSVGQTALSAEGGEFLREFVARTEQEDIEESSITSVEVARFRLLGDIIRRRENDDHLLAVHDANILFVDRGAFTLSQREVTGLLGSGLEHYASENTQLWHWYTELNGFSRNLLAIYAFLSGSNERRVGALAAARLIGELLPAGRRTLYLEAWFSNDAANAVKVAALGYLGEYGTSGDLPTIKQELGRGEYQTTSACIDAIIRINLKESREKAILALYELQPESINRNLLDVLFENSAAISTEILCKGVGHRSPEVRRITVKLLNERKSLDAEMAEQLTSDNDAIVRFEAVQSLISNGKSLSDDGVKSIIIKPSARSYGLGGFGGFGGAPTDSAGEACWKQYEEQRMTKMPTAELEKIAGNQIHIYDSNAQTARFILFDRQFAKLGDDLRKAVDDHFDGAFKDALTDAEALDKAARDYGRVGDLAEKTKSLEDYICEDLTRKGLDLICRKSDPRDLGRIRRIFKSGYVDYSDVDVEYLRKFGEWEDIPLIIASLERPRSGQMNNLLSWVPDSSRYRNAARAVYNMGRMRLAELLIFPMPTRLLAYLIVQSSDGSFHGLNDGSIFPLLFSESSEVRKATALKCVRALPKARLKAILEEYVSGDQQHYYNVVHWLDLGVSIPRDRAVAAAEKAIRKSWRE